MSIAESSYRVLDGFSQVLADVFGHDVTSFCDIVTSDSEHVLVGCDGSLMSMIDLAGSLKKIGPEFVEDYVVALHGSLASVLSKPGYSMQVVFEYDPQSAYDRIIEELDPVRLTAKRMGFDIDEVFEDTARSVAHYSQDERVVLALWTKPDALSRSEQRGARRETKKNIRNGPPLHRNTQSVCSANTRLRGAHSSYVESVCSAFKNVGIIVRKLNAHDALWRIRHTICPEFTSLSWKALLPGDPLPLRTDSLDPSIYNLLYPSVSSQIWPREAELEDRQTVRIGDRIHAPVMMELPPEDVRSFDTLFDSLRDKKIPWRSSFLLDSAPNDPWFKQIVAGVFGWASSSNKLFNKAVKDMRKHVLNGGHRVSFRAMFNTWVSVHEGQAMKNLADQRYKLVGAVQGWGISGVSEAIGEPLLGVAASVPGLVRRSPSAQASGPLKEVLYMLPITRQASPWAHGNVLFRTVDGKLYPYAHNSSKQSAWIELIGAPMGKGKSALSNSMNLAFCLQPGLKELPYLSILDIGPSSKGFISLLRAMLPEGQKHLAVYHELRNSKEDAINPLDTPLGSRYPTVSQEIFLINFLSLLATPTDKDCPEKDIPDLAKAACKRAYDDAAKYQRALYNAKIDSEVNGYVEKLNISVGSDTTWWDIVDALFERGFTREASLAQRYAVPTVATVAKAAKVLCDSGSSLFENARIEKERVGDVFYRRLVSAIEKYPVLRGRTAFELGEAKVVALDLDEVAPKGGGEGDRQTAVYYMLARQVSAGHFFINRRDVQKFPDMYREYHQERVKQLNRLPKKLVMDETHRLNGMAMVLKQFIQDLETAGRESRKRNLAITMISQKFEDFPPIMCELATSVFILGVGTRKVAQQVADEFGLEDHIRDLLPRIPKPNKGGSNFIGIFKTEDGEAVQYLSYTLGLMALWAVSTVKQDSEVRDALYEKYETSPVLRSLARLFPGGVQKEEEKRRRCYIDRGELSIDVLDEIIEEVAADIISPN